MKNVRYIVLATLILLPGINATSQVDYGSNKQAGKYIDVNDIKIYYEIYGEGEPLLLLGGNSGSIENFANNIPQLSKHFKVIVGDHDIINIDQTVSLYTSLPHAQLLIVPGASHLVLIEQPELLCSEINKFFSTQYRDIDRFYFFKLVQ